MTELQNPEFWVAFAFCAVVLIMIKPLKQKLSEWGKVRAALIKKEIDESHQLREQAEALYEEYRERTKNSDKECLEIINEAKKEAVLIQQDADEKICQRLAVRKKDVQDRIKAIETNAGQDITAVLLKQVVNKTKELLQDDSTPPSEKEMDKALDKVFHVLEQATFK